MMWLLNSCLSQAGVPLEVLVSVDVDLFEEVDQLYRYLQLFFFRVLQVVQHHFEELVQLETFFFFQELVLYFRQLAFVEVAQQLGLFFWLLERLDRSHSLEPWVVRGSGCKVFETPTLRVDLHVIN